MRLRSDCMVNSLRGKHLLTLGDGRSFEVNESFALLWEVAAAAGEFTVGTLAEALVSNYEISPEEASSEAARTIDLWQENSLTEQ